MEEQNERKKKPLLFNELDSTMIDTIDTTKTGIFFNGKDINLTFHQADLEMLLSITFSIIVNDACVSPKRNESNMCNKKTRVGIFIFHLNYFPGVDGRWPIRGSQ